MKVLIAMLWTGLAFGQGQKVLRGTVKQTLDAGQYTYILVATPEGDKWAAVTKAKLKDGAKVAVIQDMVMNNFESPTLKRKFDHVVFGVLEGKLPAGHPPLKGKDPVAKVPVKPVEKTGDPDGRTVQELFAGKAELKGRIVAVRGRVVKYNGQIMGHNWLHLRDGSGTEAVKDNDIPLTSADTAAVGDVVTARGVVGLDKDFGAGYKYDVIIEKASLSR